MDLRRVADLVVRNHASFSLINSSASSTARTLITRSNRLSNISTCQSCRQLSTRPASRQPQTARKGEEEVESQEPPSNPLKSRNSFLDDVMAKTQSTTRSPRATDASPLFGQPKPSRSSSVDDILRESRPPPNPFSPRIERSTSSSWGSPQRTPTLPPSNASRYSAQNLAFPSTSTHSSLTTPSARPRVVEELDIHVKPRTGRTIPVNVELANDLGAKLRALDVMLARNKVKGDARMQKFYERPGLKRKRLNSTRWRKEFKGRFTAAITRVNELKMKGW